jgi:hypothetical protein
VTREAFPLGWGTGRPLSGSGCLSFEPSKVGTTCSLGDWGGVFADEVVATAFPRPAASTTPTVVNIAGQSYRMRARVPSGRRTLLCSAEPGRLCNYRGDLSAGSALTQIGRCGVVIAPQAGVGCRSSARILPAYPTCP